MIWTLNKFGTFEENLDRVAQAGYHHVELVGEFKKWSEEDYRRILARMQALKISVDATSGVARASRIPQAGTRFSLRSRRLSQRPSGCSAGRSFCSRVSVLRERLPGANMQRRSGAETRGGCAEQRRLVAGDRTDRPDRESNDLSRRSDEAFEIAQAVGSPNVRVLYDVYHEQREFGNLIEKFEGNIGQVGLIHIADVPGRHEPGTGEINYLNIC